MSDTGEEWREEDTNDGQTTPVGPISWVRLAEQHRGWKLTSASPYQKERTLKRPASSSDISDEETTGVTPATQNMSGNWYTPDSGVQNTDSQPIQGKRSWSVTLFTSGNYPRTLESRCVIGQWQPGKDCIKWRVLFGATEPVTLNRTNQHLHCFVSFSKDQRRGKVIEVMRQACQQLNATPYLHPRCPLPDKGIKPVQGVELYLKYMWKTQSGQDGMKAAWQESKDGNYPCQHLFNILTAKPTGDTGKNSFLSAHLIPFLKSLTTEADEGQFNWTYDEVFARCYEMYHVQITNCEKHIHTFVAQQKDRTPRAAIFNELQARAKDAEQLQLTEEQLCEYADCLWADIESCLEVTYLDASFADIADKTLRLHLFIKMCCIISSTGRPDNYNFLGIWMCGEPGYGKTYFGHFICNARSRTKFLCKDAKGVGRYKFTAVHEVLYLDEHSVKAQLETDNFTTLNQILDGQYTEVKVHSSTQIMSPKWVIVTANHPMSNASMAEQLHMDITDPECAKYDGVQSAIVRRYLEVTFTNPLSKETVSGLINYKHLSTLIFLKIIERQCIDDIECCNSQLDATVSLIRIKMAL
jgi:hypothetical protein